MKKRIWTLLAALCLLWPAGSLAEGLAGFEEAIEAAAGAAAPSVEDLVGPVPRGPLAAMHAGDEAGGDADAQEAVEPTAQPQQEDEPAAETAAFSAVSDDLTLEMTAASARLDEGKSVELTITVSNPRAAQTPVSLTLDLPERLSCAQETSWEAVLPAAGAAGPSVTAFTRELRLGEGGVGERVTLTAELNVGTRFYRAQTELELCVSDVSVETVAQGAEDGRVQPGQAFAYRVDVTNGGTAARDVALELVLPEGLTFAGELPKGFKQTGSNASGTVRAEAAAQRGGSATPSRASVSFPVAVDANALEGDEDASRLLTGVMRVDGERVSMPRVQVCGPRITAKLIPEADSLETGAQMDLRIVVANAGLAPADVRVSCLLPEGLTLAPGEETATPGEAAEALPPEDGSTPQAAAMLTEEAEQPVAAAAPENDALVYDVHMDAAQEADGGVTASTKVITVRVQADTPQHALRERLVGAALAYTTGADTRLAEAVAVRVYTPSFLGITRDEWGGIFWAVVLLTITVSCLYAAVKVDKDDSDYAFD